MIALGIRRTRAGLIAEPVFGWRIHCNWTRIDAVGELRKKLVAEAKAPVRWSAPVAPQPQFTKAP